VTATWNVKSVIDEGVLLEIRDFISTSEVDAGGRVTLHVTFMAVFVTVMSVDVEGGSAEANVHSSSAGVGSVD
jgi:hypothetical protein